jgi:hypothetical protein
MMLYDEMHEEKTMFKNKLWEHRSGRVLIGVVGTLLLAILLATGALSQAHAQGSSGKTGGVQKGNTGLKGGGKGGAGDRGSGTISIISDKNGGITISPSELRLPSGSGMLWSNQTDATQTLISDGGSKDITLAPQEVVKMGLGGPQKLSWHLQSHPDVRAAIVTYGPLPIKKGGKNGNGNTVLIQPAKDGSSYTFSPDALKLPAGSGLLWANGTDKTQIIVPDAGGKTITLAPKALAKEGFEQKGSYSFHLQANPNAHITIYVVSVPSSGS